MRTFNVVEIDHPTKSDVSILRLKELHLNKDKGNRFIHKTDALIYLKLSAFFYESSFCIQLAFSVYPRWIAILV
jgi:hypothetical protein